MDECKNCVPKCPPCLVLVEMCLEQNERFKSVLNQASARSSRSLYSAKCAPPAQQFVTSKVARICSTILIFGRGSLWQACKARKELTAIFILAASSQLVHLCFHIVNSQPISYSAGSSSDFRAQLNDRFQKLVVMISGINSSETVPSGERRNPKTISQMVTESIQ